MPRWRTPKEIEKRYVALCEKMYLSTKFYDLSFDKMEGSWEMIFRKQPKIWDEYIRRFGKNIHVTDRHDLETEDIVLAALDRYIIENSFRQTKDRNLVGALPIRHWTDSKIRCHLLTCVVALTYIELIRKRLEKANLDLSAPAAIGHMKNLHSCLCWKNKQRKPVRIIEQPTKEQAKILKAFDHKITPNGVLQAISL